MKKQNQPDDKKSILTSILEHHEQLWNDQESTLRAYKEIYENRFWDSYKGLLPPSAPRGLQTSHVWNFVESYVSAIFLKYPAIKVSIDPTTQNDPEPVQVIANRWLTSRRVDFEDATRQALLYPCSFIKLSVGSYDEKNPVSILESIHIEALKPWDVILDVEANNWKQQRYCGHIYYKPLKEAIDIYGDAQFKPKTKNPFFKDTKKHYGKGPSSDSFKYVKIIELWDFLEDRLYIWTPDCDGGFAILDEEQIPIRDNDDKPLAQIVPLYLSWKPDMPLMGMSAVSRVYDKAYELNVAITHRASAVKKNARKYIADKTRLTDLNIADWQSAEDGNLILVENAGDPAQVIRQVAVAPLDVDFNIYIQELRKDLDEATTLPAWARGQTTGDTATEVQLANSYAENELGKMARQKDEMFERTAELYIRMLYTLMEDDDIIPVEVDEQSMSVKREALSGAYRYSAVDGGASPGALMMKAQSLMVEAPQLIQLGANPRAILEEVVRIKDYPESILEVEEVDAPTNPLDVSAQQSTVSGMPAIPTEMSL